MPSPAFHIVPFRPLKRVERAIRALFIGAVAALMPRQRGGIPDWSARPHRVLYLRHDRIGDMIVATGLIRAIATSHPTVTLDVLASPTNARVLAHEHRVGRVLRFDRSRPATWWRSIREMRAARYDAVIDCMVFSPSVTTLLLMLASGARHRIGIGGRANDAAYTIAVPPRDGAVHHIDQAAALGVAFGLDPERTDWTPEIVLTPDEREEGERAWGSREARRERRILVNVSAGKARRAWPDERYVAIVKHLREREPRATVLLTGAPDEQERLDRIAREGGVTPRPADTLRQAFALVAAADFVFTPDTSIGHAASAFRVPAVIMFARRMAPLWGPYRTPGRTPSSTDRTLEPLPLNEVRTAVDELLDETAPRSRA